MESGWVRGTASGELTSPITRKLHIESLGWAPSTPAGGVSGEVLVVADVSPENIKSMAAQAKGKLIVYDAGKIFAQGWTKVFANLLTSYQTFKDAGANGFIFPDREKDNVLNAFSPNWGSKLAVLPAAQIGMEDWQLLRRLAEKGPVSLRFEIQNTTTGPIQVNNIVAEIKGSQHPDEWILIGGHFDSWDFGTGAQDNGTGSAMLAQKKKVPGFGHRVYHTEDPRATHLRKMSHDLGQSSGEPKWFDISNKIEQFVKSDKKLNANVDFYSASTYHTLGIDVDLFTPIFAVSRISGWTAHVGDANDAGGIANLQDGAFGHNDIEVDGVFRTAPVADRARNIGRDRDVVRAFTRDFNEALEDAFFAEAEDPCPVDRDMHADGCSVGVAVQNKFAFLHIEGDGLDARGGNVHGVGLAIGRGREDRDDEQKADQETTVSFHRVTGSRQRTKAAPQRCLSERVNF